MGKIRIATSRSYPENNLQPVGFFVFFFLLYLKDFVRNHQGTMQLVFAIVIMLSTTRSGASKQGNKRGRQEQSGPVRRIDPTKDIIMDYNNTWHEFETIRHVLDQFLPRIVDLQSKQPTKCEQKMWHANSLPHKEYGTLEDQGTPGAEEEKSANHTAAMAFKSEDSYPWMSKKLPAAVWYHFNQNFTLAKISFASRRHFPKSWGQTPETFDIIGSHDCLNWVVLKTVIAAGFTGPGQTQSYRIPCSKQGEYSCYGINTTRVASSSPNYAKYGGGRVWKRVSITDIKMYY